MPRRVQRRTVVLQKSGGDGEGVFDAWAEFFRRKFVGPYLAIQTYRIISWLDGTPKKEKKAGEESIPLLRNSYMQECSGRQVKKERERERGHQGSLRRNEWEREKDE